MKNTLFAALFILAAGAVSAGDKIIASWDFSQKDPLTSGSAKLKLRGNSAVDKGMLIVSNDDKAKPSGAIVWNKKALALPPKGAFSLSITFMIAPRWVRPAKQSAYLFDTKYVENKPGYHKGLMFYLSPAGENDFIPCAVFGFGEKSVKTVGKKVTLTPEELHTAELVFTGKGKVSFSMDGKPCGEGTVPEGDLVSSKYAPVLGNRVGSDYGPLGGAIQKVVLKETAK